MRRTKIVATLGPVCDTRLSIEDMIRSGVNIFRFNMKHATRDWHDERIALVRSISQQIGIPIGILIDLQGPEIRVETPNKQDVVCTKGSVLTFRLVPREQSDIGIPTKEVFTAIKPDHRVLIDDGSVELVVKEAGPDWFTATISTDYTIKHRKSLNIPGVDIDLPSLIEDDYHKLDMTNIGLVDFVALSFTRTRKDVDHLREELTKRNLKAWIAAKIENQMALDHIDELIDSSDSIMVARGDLGVETPMEQLAYHQKLIISKCREKNKPVITATQMLHSMVHNPRPTRAEMCDVANAVYDGTDATMLSEETAGGAYPVQTVKTMEKIISFTETVAKIPQTANRFEEKIH